jgi:hypothetical protein
MSPHPGQIKEIVQNDLPRPRNQLSLDFLAQQQRLMALLTGTAIKDV